MQIDTIELAQGNSKRDDDGAWKPGQSLTEDLDKRGLPDQGMRKVYHMVDLATNYSFLAAAPKVDQDSAIKAVTEFIQNIRDQFGDGTWPHDEPFTIISDSGRQGEPLSPLRARLRQRSGTGSSDPTYVQLVGGPPAGVLHPARKGPGTIHRGGQGRGGAAASTGDVGVRVAATAATALLLQHQQ